MRKIILTSVVLLFSIVVWAQTNNQGIARVQFIHNSPDPTLAQIDVYLGEILFVNNIAFRTATPFVDVQPGTSIKLSVCNASSTGAAQSFQSIAITLVAGRNYIIVADGVRSTIAMRPNDPFRLSVHDARVESLTPENVDILVHDSSQNTVLRIAMPTSPAEIAVEDIFYTPNAAGYFELAVQDYIVAVNSRNDNQRIAAYSAPVATLRFQGRAITIIASGYSDPNPELSDAEFGLYAAVAEGGNLIPFPLIAGSTLSFQQGNILMHPNPASHFLNFEIPFAVRKIRAQIIDNTGRQIRVVEDFGIRLDISDLPEEVYTINLEIDGRIYTDKFVKGLH